MSEKVYVSSQVRGNINVTIPQIGFKRTWTRKGMRIPIDKEKLEEMIFDPGFERMLQSGVLYIDDMNVKKELGLEPEEAEVPVNILILDEKKMKELMALGELWRFKKEIGKYSVEQCKNLADYVLANKLFDYEKCSIIKEITGIDVLKMHEFEVAEAEAIEREKNQKSVSNYPPGPFNPSMPPR